MCEACFNLGLSDSVRLIAHLYSLRNEANVAGQRRFGITSKVEQLGVAMPVLRGGGPLPAGALAKPMEKA